MTNSQVAAAFVNYKEGNSEHMFSTRSRLYSYRLQIAHWNANGEIELDYAERRGHTVTTQRHMRELEAAMRGNGHDS